VSPPAARIARSPLAAPLRRAASALLGGRRRQVRVLTGAGRGGRMVLDLGHEKAYWAGVYEPLVQEVLRERLRAGAFFWDVGAHIGFFSVCAVRLGARALAFEPAPANAERLRLHGALNGFDVIEAAAWSDDRGVDLLAGPSSEQWRASSGGPTRSVVLDAAELRAAGHTTLVCELHSEEAAAGVRALLAGWRLRPLGHEWRLLAEPRN